MFKFNKSLGLPRRSPTQAGQASRLLLVLAVVVFVAVIIVFLVMKTLEKPSVPVTKVTNNEAPLPVYQITLGTIKFIFESAIDKGGILYGSQAINRQSTTQVKDLIIENPGAKFIQVTVGAQNIGTANTQQGAWVLENVVDSEGRNFESINDYSVSPWVLSPSLCGAILKPAFDPSPCTKIYEVSKLSKGLKIRVMTGKNNSANNLSSKNANTYLLDLIVK